MDIAKLEMFVEVMRQGSFAAVARDRNLDPSSVSRAIATLESELGLRLFQRTTRQLSPTEAGTAYCQRIEPLLEDMRQAGQLAADLTHQPQGTLRVTTSVSFGQKCVVPLLAEFSQRYPELAVELLLTDAVVDLVGDRVDLALRLGRLTDSTLIAQRLRKTRYAVCASPRYLQHHAALTGPEDIAHHSCLRFPLAGFRSRWIFRDPQGRLTSVAVTGRTTISNAVALQQCAVAGMGLALLPNWLISDDLHQGTLVDVFPDYDITATDFDTAIWCVYPSRAYVPLKVRVFIEEMRRVAIW